MATPAFESNEVSLRRRNPWFAASALLLPALTLAMGFASGSIAFAVLVPVAALVALLGWAANPRPRERLGRLFVNELGVFFDGVRLTSRSAVRAVRLHADGVDGSIVRVEGTAPSIELRLRAADVKRLRAALPVPLPATLTLPSRAFADPGKLARVAMIAVLWPMLFPAIGLAAMNHRGVAAFLIAMAVAITVFMLSFLMSSTKVRIEANALTIAWLRRRRRIAFSEIESARIYAETEDAFGSAKDSGLAIALRSGEIVRLAESRRERRDELAFFAKRIDEACLRARSAGVSPEGSEDDGQDEERLRGRGRSAGAWLRALRGIGTGANANHRSAPVTTERLWRFVEDAGAPVDLRVGAAVALGESLDEGGKTRLRIAALSTGTAEARAAIEAAADDAGEEDLEAALEEVRRSQA